MSKNLKKYLTAYIPPIFFIVFLLIALIILKKIPRIAETYISSPIEKAIKKVDKTLNLSKTAKKLGLKKNSIAGFYEAKKSQDLAYDYTNDGKVTGEDYKFLVEEVQPDSPPTTATAEVVAAGDMTITADEEGTSAEGENPYMPSVDAFSSDVFNGAATVSYPISLPPGPGGLQPSAALSYSTAVIDDLWNGVETKWRNDNDHSFQRQSGVFGLGWNLGGLGYVARDMGDTLNKPEDDKFSLVFAGGSAKLVKESDDGYVSVWRTVPNLFIRVERYSICKQEPPGADVCRFHWEVTTGDGTKYIFGSLPVDNWHVSGDPDTSYWPQGSGNSWYKLLETESPARGTRPWKIYYDALGISRAHAITYQWLLLRVENIYSHQIVYENDTPLGTYSIPDVGDYKYVKTIYPYKINYGAHEVEFVKENAQRKDIDTHYEDKTSVPQANKSFYRIRKIVVKTSGKVRNAYTFEYKYAYDSQDHPDAPNSFVGGKAVHSLLTKITQWSDDPDTNPNAQFLPAYTFSYGDNCGTFVNACPLSSFIAKANSTQQQTPNDFFLKMARNGYSGAVEYEYWDNGSDGNALLVKYCDRDKVSESGQVCFTDNSFNAQRHRLSAKIIHDGMGNFTRTEFEYTGAGATMGLAAVKNYEEVYLQGSGCCDDCSLPEAERTPAGCCCPGDQLVCNGNDYCPSEYGCAWVPCGSGNCCPNDNYREFGCECVGEPNPCLPQ